MTLLRIAGLLIAAWVTATTLLADVRGVPNPPAFTPEEKRLINRDARLIDAARNSPWRLRQALDEFHDSTIPRPAHAAEQPKPDPQTVPEGRASAEAALDLLKILREVAGQSTNR